jgi:glycosyltransferase involved in cell wall biosynthesis
MIPPRQPERASSATVLLPIGNRALQCHFPLVSIIIPCYNGEQFIREAIDSALAQTYPHTEIIVIDDGSVDCSKEIILRYPVRYFYSHRKGVSAARNRGIQESLGEYIIFLDADDRLLPRAIHTGLALLSQHTSCCMAVGAHNIISANGKFICSRTKPLTVNDHYSQLLRSNFIECTSTALFRRDSIVQTGLFNAALHGAEDYEFYLRLARRYPICCHIETVTEYRVHDTNASRDSLLMLTSTLDVIRSQRPFVFRNPRRLLSYIFGSLSWRRQYGRQLTRELAISNDRAAYRIGHWLTLLKTYPLGTAIALAGRMLPMDITRSFFRLSETQQKL